MNPEITEQGRAFAEMHGDILSLIDDHAAEFREIINYFKKAKCRCPTADELIFIASQHAGRDLRKQPEE